MADRPATASLAGQWIKATVKNDKHALLRLENQVRDEELSVLIDAVFTLAVRTRFSPSGSLDDITRQMLGIRQRYDAKLVRPILEMEMVVRKELGEYVPIDDLSSTTTSVIKLLVIEQIVYDMALFDDEIDDLIGRAESLGTEVP